MYTPGEREKKPHNAREQMKQMNTSNSDWSENLRSLSESRALGQYSVKKKKMTTFQPCAPAVTFFLLPRSSDTRLSRTPRTDMDGPGKTIQCVRACVGRCNTSSRCQRMGYGAAGGA